jgi:hypothetical protein
MERLRAPPKLHERLQICAGGMAKAAISKVEKRACRLRPRRQKLRLISASRIA